MKEIVQGILMQWWNFVPFLFMGTLVFIGFMIAALFSREAIVKACETRGIDQHITHLLSQAAKYTLIAFGLIASLGMMGLDVSALVAGLGLSGFAVSFALKDFLSNTISGILILIHRPFRLNDVVSIDTFEGNVQSIELRYTILMDRQNKYVVPNSLVFSKGIAVRRSERPDLEG